MQNTLLSVAAIAALITGLTTISTPVWADVSLPVSEVVEAIHDGTGGTIPILVPKSLPVDAELYWTVSAEPSQYSVEFAFTPDCNGATACFWGLFLAERGGSFSGKGQGITLARGKKGQFTLFKGATYTAIVEWKEGGVLYSAVIKNGTKEDAIRLANSAINSTF